MGRRIAKILDGTTVEKYLWQGLTRLLAVYDGSNNLIMRFEYTDERMPVAMTRGGATYYLAYDQVGSLRVVADSAGNVVKKIDYDSFGNIIADTDPSFDMPFGFAGGLHDRDTCLVRFGYRDYDPDIGRWTAKDPILFAGGDTDLFGYCLSNPVNAVDPYGLEFSSGVSYNVSTINPFTSGGDGVWGLNIQNFYDGKDNVSYLYSGSGVGLDIGAAMESVWAWGSGSWEGPIESVNFSFLWFAGSIFWTPGEGGWAGFTFGLNVGLPIGLATEETNYERLGPDPCK